MALKFIETDIYETVVAICKGYERRKKVISDDDGETSTLNTYRALNEAIDRAIASVCEEGIREQIRKDIAKRRGYYYSDLSLIMSYETFFKRKKHSIVAIAKELHL